MSRTSSSEDDEVGVVETTADEPVRANGAASGPDVDRVVLALPGVVVGDPVVDQNRDHSLPFLE